jgi:acyl-coenzyme A synthetase/AMP-(fatty) acid ligase
LSLRETLRAAGGLEGRRIWSGSRRLRLADTLGQTSLGGRRRDLAGKSVLIRTRDAFSAAVALIELDGLARRLVICPPDLADEALPHVIATADIEAVVFDEAPPTHCADLIAAPMDAELSPASDDPRADLASEWVLFTSGTSGAPKMVVHSLAGLTGAIRPPARGERPVVWGTFYDVRRYGGLQILLRALLGDGSLVIPGPGEPLPEFLARLGLRGVTHLTGTPSHWRRVLMSPAAHAISPDYVRLSGEIADQTVLDSLKAFFPGVPIGHAYASTEAGVGFEVTDGLEGFPAAFLDPRDGAVEMRVRDGALQLRSARAASRYLGEGAPALAEEDGFVDTGDMVELRGDRFYFVGRRNGVINVGGLKVHPEEVEAVINRHPAVRMSLARGLRNPITGAIVVADVVLNEAAETADTALIKEEIMLACSRELAPFKTPARLRFVPTLPVNAGGKLERTIG